ncbi:hypothetical protein [Streptomyces sp. MMS24-I29]|uniref:hypothetical protein n=1 Tax=Streptomyces sp. MMS24-I29 TaxID=3351480 RepID=UPI003C7CD6BB
MSEQHASPSADVDRTIPAALVGLAEEALRSGNVDEVFLGFEGLGADFPAPIGWIMHLHRVEEVLLALAGLPVESNHLMVSAQVGGEPTAFVGIGQDYLDAEAIRQWITHPRPVEAGAPIGGLDDADMLITAVRNGWSITRKIDRNFGSARCGYTFHALNNGYAIEGSASHHSTGAPVSREFRLSRPALPAAPWNHALAGATRVAPEDVIAEISRRAPWYADVAYFDVAADEWVV